MNVVGMLMYYRLTSIIHFIFKNYLLAFNSWGVIMIVTCVLPICLSGVTLHRPFSPRRTTPTGFILLASLRQGLTVQPRLALNSFPGQ
jgi:hypothetical protein